MTRITGWRCDGCGSFHEGDSEPKVSVRSFALEYHMPKALGLEEIHDREGELEFCDWPCAKNGLVGLWPPLVGRFIEARMAEEASPPPEPAATPELLSEATEPVDLTPTPAGAGSATPAWLNPQEVDPSREGPASTRPEDA